MGCNACCNYALSLSFCCSPALVEPFNHRRVSKENDDDVNSASSMATFAWPPSILKLVALSSSLLFQMKAALNFTTWARGLEFQLIEEATELGL